MYYTKLRSIYGVVIGGFFKRCGNFYISMEHEPLPIELWKPMFGDYLLMAEFVTFSAKEKMNDLRHGYL